jgi:type I restriction enzyme M protein
VITILKPVGRAAIVVPDNVLFEENAGKEVRKLLMEDCNLRTILRLPIGTFTPYSPGVKANIMFFSKGEPTKEVWIYDNRTGVEKVAIRHPLTAEYFKDFEKCYHANPRKESDHFRRFSRKEISDRGDNLDIFWLKDEAAERQGDTSEPEEVLGEAVIQVQTAMDALNDIAISLLANRRKEGS